MKTAIRIYALLLLIGGIIGYLMAQSLPSLIMGSVSALIVTVLSFQKGKYVETAILALVGLLGAFFGYRFYLTLKFFPAGLMCLASLMLFAWLMQAALSTECCKIEPNKASK